MWEGGVKSRRTRKLYHYNAETFYCLIYYLTLTVSSLPLVWPFITWHYSGHFNYKVNLITFKYLLQLITKFFCSNSILAPSFSSIFFITFDSPFLLTLIWPLLTFFVCVCTFCSFAFPLRFPLYQPSSSPVFWFDWILCNFVWNSTFLFSQAGWIGSIKPHFSLSSFFVDKFCPVLSLHSEYLETFVIMRYTTVWLKMFIINFCVCNCLLNGQL